MEEEKIILNKFSCPSCGNILISKGENQFCPLCNEKMNKIAEIETTKKEYGKFSLDPDLFKINKIFYPSFLVDNTYNEKIFVLEMFNEKDEIDEIIFSNNELYNTEFTYVFNLTEKKLGKINLNNLIDVYKLNKGLETIMYIKKYPNDNEKDKKIELFNESIERIYNSFKKYTELFHIKDNIKSYLLSNIIIRDFLSYLTESIYYKDDVINQDVQIFLNGDKLKKHPLINILYNGKLDKHISFDKEIKIEAVKERLKKDYNKLETEEVWYKLIETYYDDKIDNNNLIESTNLYLSNKKTNEYNSIIRLMNLIDEDYNLFLNVITDKNNIYEDSFLSIIEEIQPYAPMLNNSKPIKVINSMNQGYVYIFDNIDDFKENTLENLGYSLDNNNLFTTKISKMYNEHLDEFLTEDKKNKFIELFNKYKDEESILLNEEVLNEANESFSTKRKKAENLVYKVLSALDKSNENTKTYKQMFSKMSDEQFKKYVKKLSTDEDENFFIEVLPNKNEPSLKDIKESLGILKVPLDEYVYYRHDSHENDPIRTRYKVPVGYLVLKRVRMKCFFEIKLLNLIIFGIKELIFNINLTF